MIQKKSETQVIISTPDALDGLVRKYRREAVLAFDLEADSMHHYREKVCLIQIATASEAFLIDPLAMSDISCLGILLADSAIRKVFHGADYDVRSLRRDFSLHIENLFDTMIACQFLGEKELGLAAVLKKRFGVELDKRYQKADWSRRPLAPEMMEYAIADTSLLVALYGQLEKELMDKGRLSWVEEECALLAQVVATDRNGNPFFFRFRGADKMDQRSLAVLEELLRLRDEKARLADRPAFKILSHESLSSMVERKPRKLADLYGVPGLSAKLIDRYGAEILKAVALGLSIPDQRLPVYPRSERVKKEKHKVELCKRLKLWREGKAVELGVDAGVLANNALLEALVNTLPRDMADLEKVPSLRNWQKRTFGEELLNVFA